MRAVCRRWPAVQGGLWVLCGYSTGYSRHGEGTCINDTVRSGIPCRQDAMRPAVLESTTGPDAVRTEMRRTRTRRYDRMHAREGSGTGGSPWPYCEYVHECSRRGWERQSFPLRARVPACVAARSKATAVEAGEAREREGSVSEAEHIPDAREHNAVRVQDRQRADRLCHRPRERRTRRVGRHVLAEPARSARIRCADPMQSAIMRTRNGPGGDDGRRTRAGCSRTRTPNMECRATSRRRR